MRKVVDDSKENIDAFYKHLLEIKEGVENEFRKKYGYNAKPEVMPNLDDLRRETALRLVELQNSKRVIAWSDISPLDRGRIQELQKKHKITREEVIGRLVKNAIYQSYAQIELQNYVSVLEDIDRVYNKFAINSGVFPLNALSKRTSTILKQYRVGISFVKKVEIIIKTFRPEMANVQLVQYDYNQTIKPAYYLSDEELSGLAQEVTEKFADKSGNIDKIFAPNSEVYLRNLITALKLNHITFDEFATKHSLTFTRCYSALSVPAAKQMLSAYYLKYGTYRGIQRNDGYLCKKMDMVKSIERKYSMQELLEYWGLESDNNTNFFRLTLSDLVAIEDELLGELNVLYPDSVIDKGFQDNNRVVYEKARMLAHRKNFSDLDTYLLSLGFKREKVERKTFKNKFALSERDLLYYGFINSNMSSEEVNEVLKKFDIVLLNVEDYIGFYRRLAYNKQDGLGWIESNKKNQFGDVE